MSVPLEYDFAQVKAGDGATPEVFTVICDIMDVTVTEGAETSTRYRRDCTTPGTPAKRRSRVIGTFWDITGTGIVNAPDNPTIRALNGARKNYEIDVFQDNGTAAGELLGTYSGEAIMTSREVSMAREGEGGQNITLEGQDTLSFEAVNSGS